MKTYAPSATKRLAVARPSLLLPPVIRAIFPESFPVFVLITFFPFDILFVGLHLCIGRYMQRTSWTETCQ
jgi:hypothetical protein